MRPGKRSPLGEFLFTYKHILRDGLLGGAISSHWAFLDHELRQAKLKYKGIKKKDGVKMHRVDYKAKGDKDVDISLYFDEVTFRHVMTEYEVKIAALIGINPVASPQQRATIQKVTETFKEFKEVDGFAVPTVWRIRYQRSGNQSGPVWRWTLNFNRIGQNQTVEEKYFTLLGGEPQ
jgi:hypothetical protein